MKLKIHKSSFPGTIKDRHWSKKFRTGHIYLFRKYIIIIEL